MLNKDTKFFEEAKQELRQQLKEKYKLVGLLDITRECGFTCFEAIIDDTEKKERYSFTYKTAKEFKNKFKKYRKKEQTEKRIVTFTMVTGDVVKGELAEKVQTTDAGDFIAVKQENGELIDVAVEYIVLKKVDIKKVWEE